MKKCIKIVLLAFLIVFTISISNNVFAATTTCASLSMDLSITQSDTTENGNAVSILQNFLYKNGYLTVSPTGYFGNSTFAAVKAFQVANGINSTGYVGVLTRTKIQNLDCDYIVKSPVSTTTSTINLTQNNGNCANITSDLKIGQSSGNVTSLQNFLYKNGYLTVSPTGYFGNSTFAAVKAFQVANGINSTGYVGVLTRTKIQNLDCDSTTNTTTTTNVTTNSLPIPGKLDSYAPVITFNTSKSEVELGETVELEWNAENAVDKCKITAKDTSGKVLSSSIDISGLSLSSKINKTTTFTIVCYNKYGIPGTKSTVVKIKDSSTSTTTEQNYIKSPAIASISPVNANRGDLITIKGSNFLSTNSIYFDGSKVDDNLVIYQSTTSISFRIPEYKNCLSSYCVPPANDTQIETGGKKTIQISNDNGFSNDFTITLPSKIITITGVPTATTIASTKLSLTSISPITGNRGDLATISGTGFSDDSIVLFDGFKVADNLIIYKTSTMISFIIPPYQMGCTEPDYEVCPKLPIKGSGVIIETGGIKTISVMNKSTKATTTSATFTLPSKKITY